MLFSFFCLKETFYLKEETHYLKNKESKHLKKKKTYLRNPVSWMKTYYLVSGVVWHPTSSVVVVVWQAPSRVIQFCKGIPHFGPSIRFIFFFPIRFIFFFLAVGILILSVFFFSFSYKLVRHRIYFYFFPPSLLPVLVQYFTSNL